ncbi:MAG: hypothetical protein WCO13_05960, partial [Bacteroidota bacterium]
MDDNNSLIKHQPASLTRVSKQIEFTNKILSTFDDQKYIDFFLEYPQVFVNIVAKYYKFDIELIYKFKENFDFYDFWKTLSINENIAWSLDLIKVFERDLIWESYLSNNKVIKFTDELIGSYNYWQRIDWENFSRNEKILWSAELIEKYKDKWLWGSLNLNKSINWDIELIEKFEDNCSWNYLSESNNINWNYELIDRFINKWDWKIMAENESLPWSIKFINKYSGKWNWDNLSSSKLIPWSIELIERFNKEWNWEKLSLNCNLQWSVEIIDIKYSPMFGQISQQVKMF